MRSVGLPELPSHCGPLAVALQNLEYLEMPCACFDAEDLILALETMRGLRFLSVFLALSNWPKDLEAVKVNVHPSPARFYLEGDFQFKNEFKGQDIDLEDYIPKMAQCVYLHFSSPSF
jgi:hypothetical protein